VKVTNILVAQKWTYLGFDPGAPQLVQIEKATLAATGTQPAIPRQKQRSH
jgi:hypothetical protein